MRTDSHLSPSGVQAVSAARDMGKFYSPATCSLKHPPLLIPKRIFILMPPGKWHEAAPVMVSSLEVWGRVVSLKPSLPFHTSSTHHGE